MTLEFSIDRVKHLKSAEYDTARAAAVERIKTRIGSKPIRQQFTRELGALASPLDYIALVVFIAALAISSLHIVAYMSEQATASYKVSEGNSGIVVSADVWAVTHQIGAILLAEAAALLFATQHSMSALQRTHRRGLWRYVSVPLVLAIIAAVFVLIANLGSGVNVLVGLMPPLFTLGISLRLEAMIAELLSRRADVNARYLAALDIYEKSSVDPEKHPDFRPLLKSELWQLLVKRNPAIADAAPAFKHAAVAREMARDLWAYDEAPEGEAIAKDNPFPIHPIAPLQTLITNGNGNHLAG